MFADVQISEDLGEKFKNHSSKGGGKPSIDFTVLILATGTWPIQALTQSFALTPDLESCTRAFESFYLESHSGKKLTWLHNLAKGEIKTNYTTTNKVGYTLQASGYQIGVLLHFNSAPSGSKFSLEDLLGRTQIQDQTLLPILRTLLKTRVLVASPAVADAEKDQITKDHQFSLNKDLKPPKGKVKFNINIPLKAAPEGGGDRAATGGASGGDVDVTQQQIIEERKLLMQAAIVRIMKTRKKLQHTALITEVVEQLKSRFKPQIPLIKKCIDILIEKEYLERVKGEKDMYSYLA
jgi:cullin 1